MDDLIAYNLELPLRLPKDVKVKDVTVDIRVDPPIAACALYGYDVDGDLRGLQVHGSHSGVTLPFVGPQVYVAFMDGMMFIEIDVVGWTPADEAAS